MPSPLVAAEDPDLPSDDDLTTDDDPTQACFVLHSGRAKSANGASDAVERSPSKLGRLGRRQKQGILRMPPCLKEEPIDCGLWRMEAFQTVWSEIEKGIQEVFELQNTSSFQEIQKFICDTLFCDAQLKLYLSAEAANASPVNSNGQRNCVAVGTQLHSALVFLRNVDSSDHTNTFKELASYLKKHDCHVASLLPHNFSSKAGIGGPLYSMLKQIVKINPDTTDMDILVSWHKEAANVNQPVVIIIEDAELCSSTVLANFIVILSEWITELPLVLIMGMATSGDALRKLLPASAVRRLHIQKFKLQSPDEYLEGIMKAVLVKPFSFFDLGSDVMKFLLSYFRSHDSTVTSFLRALKMACMEHFFSQPLSFLCTKLLRPPDQAEFEDFCRNLPEVLLQYASTLPSVSRHFENDYDTGKKMASTLCKLREQKQNWSAVLQCLLAAGKQVGVDCTEILEKMLQPRTQSAVSNKWEAQGIAVSAFQKGDHVHASVVNSVLLKMRDISASTLARVLNEWEKLTENLQELRIEIQALLLKLTSEAQSETRIESCSSTCNGAARRKRLLSALHDSLEEQQQTSFHDDSSNAEVFEGDQSDVGDFQADQDSVAAGMNHSKLSRLVVENNLMSHKVGTKVYNKMAVNLLEQMIRQHLVPVESLPFNEIVCFRNVTVIRKALIGESRRVIQMNLSNAQATLHCICCSSGDGDLSASMNDSSLLYNLARKHGDHINVYDLFQSFETVLSHTELEHPTDKKGQTYRKKKRNRQELDRASIQARFCKAASELQLVGLLRTASKKRSDFVQLAVL